MRLTKIDQVDEFLKLVNSCTGSVWLTSAFDDKYNLKSQLSQYIAIGALLGDEGDKLELYCSNKEDEAKFIKYFSEHPEIR